MNGNTGKALIELRHVHKSFRLSSGQKIKVLRDIDLSLQEGEVLAILGPSGSGKSTCLRIMAGLLEPTIGDVYRQGRPLEGPNPDVALVFQNFALLPWLNVAENVAVGLEPLALPEEAVRERVKKSIDLVGLEGFEEAYPRELSGGMKQRVGIARALVMERPVLCLDEPFSALDILTAETLRREVLSLLTNKTTAVKSVVLVTHNIIEAVSLGKRIVVMGTNPGQVRLVIRNDLPYPRDEKSGTFRSLVEDIHDVVTQTVIPESPEWIPPALAATAVESIPSININETIGLLEMIASQGGRADAYALAHALSKDSIQVLLMAKAAELLDLVDTPKNSIVLTDTGRKFVQGDVNIRKAVIHEQLRQLRLVQLVVERLSSREDKSLSRQESLEAVQEWLPNEPADQVLDSLIQWGRYGEVLGYNADEERLYLDTGAEAVH